MKKIDDLISLIFNLLTIVICMLPCVSLVNTCTLEGSDCESNHRKKIIYFTKTFGKMNHIKFKFKKGHTFIENI